MGNRQGHHHSTTAGLRTAFFLNLVFTVVEIVGGFLTNSLAILSDAMHDLGDAVSLGLGWYLEHFSQKESDRRYTYGYRRFSLLGALINTVILIIGALYIALEAIPRLFAPERPNAQGMAILALGGILVNGIAAFRLRRDGTFNARTIGWHFIEDVLGWIAVLVVSIILLFADLYFLDPLLSILISIYVLYNVIRNLRQTLGLFLQAVPARYEIEKINERLLKIENVESVHHTHIWSLDGVHHVLTTHVVVSEDTPRESVKCVKQDIRELVKELDISHITIDIEYGDTDCMMLST
ncbi:MAG: cation diffusion facilitator family transporter [Anaerolineales bacterium]|jgi:cobalt-zinc-cadmium efflux system protein